MLSIFSMAIVACVQTESRPVAVSPVAARVFQAAVAPPTQLPAQMEISYRPIVRAPFQWLIHHDRLKALFVGYTVSEPDGDGLKRRYAVDFVEMEREGRTLKIPLAVTYEIRIRKDGEYLEIGRLSPLPDSPPDSSMSLGDWKAAKAQILPVIIQVIERARDEECTSAPRYAGGKVSNDSSVGISNSREFLRRAIECVIAGEGVKAAEIAEYRRDPERFIDLAEERLAKSDIRIDSDQRVRGTTRLDGNEFLVVGGTLRVTGRGNDAARMMKFPLPEGARVEAFEVVIDLSP